MKKIEAKIAETIQTIPRLLVKRLVQEKLAAQNLDNERLVEALTEHILNHPKEPFKWSEREEQYENVVITFTDEDFSGLIEKFDNLTNSVLPEALTKAIASTSAHTLKQLERDWPMTKLSISHEMQGFRDRLDLRWAPAIDPLRMMLLASQDLGEAFVRKLARSKAKKGIIKRQALSLLHARACQNVLEIVTLLEHGFADGAFARWRTLYEISVVCFLIDRFGDEIAERYLDHEAVSEWEDVVNQLRHEGNVQPSKTLDSQLKELKARYSSAISKYGTSFSKQYGWAAHHLNLKNPQLKDLEEAVNWSSLPPEYKWSSYKIHAGIAGITWTLTTIAGERFIHSGSSDAGIQVPAINTAYTLLHITSVIFGGAANLSAQVQMNILIMLRDKVLKNAQRIARQLEREYISSSP